MSEEMAISDNAMEKEALMQNDESTGDTLTEAAEASPEQFSEVPVEQPEEPQAQTAEARTSIIKEEPQDKLTEEKYLPHSIKNEPKDHVLETSIIKEEIEETEQMKQEYHEQEDDKRGIKRRASAAFSDDGDVEFLGFTDIKQENVTMEYNQILERLEAEVNAASKGFTPVRFVMATPPAPMRASKRSRKDTGTDGSRPSSAQSSRSEDDNPSASPAQRGRRATTEISSPLLRMPLERGWKRELVYRAALDMHSRRNADIYYYTPAGKKLRSTREISEHLSGTGFTLDNFSFFKEPLGVDDPEKEIIRDAKVMRRVESPIASPAPQVDGKRPHKPKAPKGASPEPSTPKSPPVKLKVKSVGSRLSGPAVPMPIKQEKQKKGSPAPRLPSPAPILPSPAPASTVTTLAQTATATPDNNNTAAWKKPRAPPAAPEQAEAAAEPYAPLTEPRASLTEPRLSEPRASVTEHRASLTDTRAAVRTRSRSSRDVTSAPRDLTPAPRDVTPAPRDVTPAPRDVTPAPRDGAARKSRDVTPVTRDVKTRDVAPVPRLATPPPQPRLQELSSPDIQSPRRLVQPCSLSCGAGVPSLSCAACLCMYHPACVSHAPLPNARFLCSNCRTSPPPAPVPAPAPAPAPRRAPSQQKPNEKRVTLRMKVSGGSDGSRVWAVAGPPPRPAAPCPAPAPAPAPAPLPASATPTAPAPRRAALPQSLALINGKRFIVVPRPAPLPPQPQPAAHDTKLRSRVANGAASPSPCPPALASSRRRGRPRTDDTDYFSAFYTKAQQGKTNIVIQIFQYLGMRDLAHCARVCKLWKQLAATPSLWRHVRMKNSQVSDWGGLCAALKRHGTKWLDLRKMLLPQNDTIFWDQFAQHIGTVDTLERLEMCRCPARAVESACGALRGLRALSALAIRDAALDPAPLASAPLLRELRLKSMSGLALTADLTHLASLAHLQHLSLTSIKELGWRACEVIGSLSNLESLELGECTFRAEFASVLARLTRLTRLRLERGTAACAAPAILRALATLPRLVSLELVNVDVKVGFDDALAECTNIQRLLIIPTYVSQSATTNKQVLSGVLRLKSTLTHLMWGVTIELLRVTELFIDQCSAGAGARRELGECIPVLKPVPGCRLPMDHQLVAGPPQVEILPLPTLQRLLSSQLPNTKLKLLRIPFHATWRQSLADFQ